ncbi:TetR/AcrR family transcriptional regulator [Sorangium sp. KYC3313]|uniref:TetR/AcrR family transcriptional regulator n=1 Tax=unclassified Sorangium TaxID=2621164 RepID=UPI003F63EFF9
MAARSPDSSRRNERSHRAILAAAGELLMDVGYAKLTIEAIAARAGVGKQTIYRWWPSKGAVVFDALLAMNEGPSGVVLPDTGNIGRDLQTVLRATVEEFLDSRIDATLRALTIEIQHDRDLATRLVERLLGPQMDATVDRLRVAQRAGQIRADVDLQVAVELLYGPIFHRWLLRTAPLCAAYADTVTALALAALRP